MLTQQERRNAKNQSQISFAIDATIAKKFRILTMEQNTTMKDVLSRYINEYVINSKKLNDTSN